MENQNRTRSHQILFRVSDEEYKIIRRKMIMLRMRNREAFIRKMLIEGVIINVDTAPLESIFVNGLATSMPTKDKGKSYKEHQEYNRGNSWKSKLKVAVDKAIWKSLTYEEFLMQMQTSGYENRQGKNLAFRASDQKHFTNMKSRQLLQYRKCHEEIREEPPPSPCSESSHP